MACSTALLIEEACCRQGHAPTRLPRLTTFSAYRCSASAFCTVVHMRSCSSSCVTMVLQGSREEPGPTEGSKRSRPGQGLMLL